MWNLIIHSKNHKTGGKTMKSNGNMKTVLHVLERIARVEVENNSKQWPPICMGLLYQPKRPKREEK